MDNSKILKISRANLQLFKECPRCFWLYKNKGIGRPRSFPYTLSIAVDALLKREFDKFRERGELHPAFVRYGIKDAKLFDNWEKLKMWRNNFQGLKYYDRDLNAYLFGAVDDILQFNNGNLAVVDYKSSGAKEVSIYASYQTQMDVYTYILSQLQEPTSDKAFFLFYQVNKEDGFDGRLSFIEIIEEVKTDPSYVRKLFEQAVDVARRDNPPKSHSECEYCTWATHHKHYG